MRLRHSISLRTGKWISHSWTTRSLRTMDFVPDRLTVRGLSCFEVSSNQGYSKMEIQEKYGAICLSDDLLLNHWEVSYNANVSVIK